jgi:DNA-binding transcriptional LysR family regulator
MNGAPDLNLLVALHALLEEVNVTHAGSKIGLSQPAMSAALSRLRRHFNDDLLIRVGRSYELTPFAESILPTVQSSIRKVELALRIDSTFDPLTSDREFSIGLSDYASIVLTGHIQNEIVKKFPNLTFSFSDLPDDVATSDRSLLRHDFMIGPLGIFREGRSLPIFNDQMVLIMDMENPLAAKSKLTMTDIADARFAVATFSGAPTTPIDRVFGELNFKRNIVARVNGFLPLPLMVKGNSNVAVVPARLAARFSRDRRLHIAKLPIEFKALELHEAIWWHSSREESPAHKWLLSRFAEMASSSL